jgi:hypothetical protein
MTGTLAKILPVTNPGNPGHVEAYLLETSLEKLRNPILKPHIKTRKQI